MNRPADILRVGLCRPRRGWETWRGTWRRSTRGSAGLSGADLVVTPELALHGYHLSGLDDVERVTADDGRISGLGRHGPAVVVGFAESWRHHRYNSAALVDGDRVALVQRKLFLPTYQAWEERKHFRPGNRMWCADVRGTRVGLLICNDLWQPPLPWLAAHGGAEVLVVVVNSVESHAAVPVRRAWDLLIGHAAVTLQCYVVFVNRSGDENGGHFWGRSHVAGPDGETFAHLGEEPGHALAELDLAALRRLRRRWPLLQDSRYDLVAREVSRLASEEE